MAVALEAAETTSLKWEESDLQQSNTYPCLQALLQRIINPFIPHFKNLMDRGRSVVVTDNLDSFSKTSDTGRG